MTKPQDVFTAIAGHTPILSAVGVRKAYGHVEALQGVDLDLFPGEVLALVGDNGAGKSTLIRILSGVSLADSGEIRVDGSPITFDEPSDAAAAGIATVYQDLALVENRDVAQNVFLGREFTRGPGHFLVDAARGRDEATRVIATLGMSLPSLRVPVRMLSGGQRQTVAVARALAQGARILILDEPTAALGVPESARVLAMTRELRSQGTSVILISHNLQHVFEVADRMIVLHRGRVAGVCDRASTSVDHIIELITFGRARDTNSASAASQ